MSEEYTLIYEAVENAAGPIPVAFPNRKYPEDGQPGDVPFYAVSIISTSKTGLGVAHNSTNRQMGMIQVSCYVRDDKGEIKAVEMADNIADAFPRGTRLIGTELTVKIDQPPYKTQGFSASTRLQNGIKIQGGWYMIPVTIPYYIYT